MPQPRIPRRRSRALPDAPPGLSAKPIAPSPAEPPESSPWRHALALLQEVEAALAQAGVVVHPSSPRARHSESTELGALMGLADTLLSVAETLDTTAWPAPLKDALEKCQRLRPPASATTDARTPT